MQVGYLETKGEKVRSARLGMKSSRHHERAQMSEKNFSTRRYRPLKDSCTQTRAKPVASAASALTKGTTGVELVSGAERATTAKPKALEPGEYRKDVGTKYDHKARLGKRAC